MSGSSALPLEMTFRLGQNGSGVLDYFPLDHLSGLAYRLLPRIAELQHLHLLQQGSRE